MESTGIIIKSHPSKFAVVWFDYFSVLFSFSSAFHENQTGSASELLGSDSWRDGYGIRKRHALSSSNQMSSAPLHSEGTPYEE